MYVNEMCATHNMHNHSMLKRICRPVPLFQCLQEETFKTSTFCFCATQAHHWCNCHGTFLPLQSCANKMFNAQGVHGASTKSGVPSWGRALASAGFVLYAGNHRGMPCTISLLKTKWIKENGAILVHECQWQEPQWPNKRVERKEKKKKRKEKKRKEKKRKEKKRKEKKRKEKKRPEKKRKEKTFWRQIHEKPSIIPSCPGHKRVPFE